MDTGRRPAGPLERLRQDLRNRSDSEHEQALLRVLIVGLVFGYFAWTNHRLQGSDPEIHTALLVCAGVLAFSFGLLLHVLFRPGPLVGRRLLGMVLDLGATSYGMYAAGEVGAPLFGVYLWVTMGNGFRYGRRYLFAATALSLAGFGVVLLSNAYWRTHPVFGVSLLIVLAVIPLYVSSLLRKLEDAISRAQEANRAKSRFLANMSHELRTPLNGVIGMSEILAETPLSGSQRELARTIQSSARILLGLIENVLDISKIEAGKLSAEAADFDLHSLVASTVKVFEHQARDKGLSLRTRIAPDIPFLLRGDLKHLQQVLTNLLGNAVKFTHEGMVEVVVESMGPATEPLWLRFEVRDTGIGIPEAAQARIFERFNQADSQVTRRYGGTGLGTTIARELVHLMGGRIGFDSVEGEGTVFWIELPFALQLVPRPARMEPPTGLQGTRVLVVAQEVRARELQGHLAGWGVQSRVVHTDVEALEWLAQLAHSDRPCPICMVEELALGMGAEQFAAAVYAHHDRQQLSLVLLVPLLDARRTRSLLADGYDAVLPLPVDKRLLFNAVHAAHQSRAADENVVSLADHYRRQGPARPLRILAAEDNHINRLVLRQILERAELSVLVVEDGERALDVLSAGEERFDMLILDMNMPGVGGLDVARAFRFMDTGATIPIVILTADATPEAAKACQDAGVDAHLTKPIDPRLLLDTIAQLARRAPLPVVPPKGERALDGESNTRPDVRLDEYTLTNLLVLGGGARFVAQLAEGFANDGERTFGEIETALADRDYPRFHDALHALKGSAGELGGTLVVRLCNEGRAIKPYELESPRTLRLAADLRRAFDATCVALTEYLARERDAVT